MRHACRECWDQVDADGAELCDWCAATPGQRKKMYRRAMWSLAGALAFTIGCVLLGDLLAR